MTAGLFLVDGDFFFSSSDAQGLVRFQDKRDTALFDGSTQTRSPLTLGGPTMARLAARAGTVAVS